MRKVFVALLWTLAIVIIVLTTLHFYFKYQTVYMSYDGETYAGQKIEYIGVEDGITLKGYPVINYPEQTIITDKQIIKKVFDYLNSIPLNHASENVALKNITRQNARIDFYNENNIVMGTISFRGEEYIATNLYDGDVYRVRDKGTQIVVGLEALNLK